MPRAKTRATGVGGDVTARAGLPTYSVCTSAVLVDWDLSGKGSSAGQLTRSELQDLPLGELGASRPGARRPPRGRPEHPRLR